MRWFLIALALCVGLFWVYVERQRHQVIASLDNEDPLKFEREIAYIENRYVNGTEPGRIIFMGDSLIRLWSTLPEDVAPFLALNHGFGGSRVKDNIYYVDRLVTPFEPSALVISVGTNDIHGLSDNSKSGEEVAELLIELFDTVHAKHPELPIFYISMTPVPVRWKVWNEAEIVNDRIKAHAETDPRLEFIDLRSEFLPEGKLVKRFYDSDDLHFSPEGYAIWAEHIPPVVERTLQTDRN